MPVRQRAGRNLNALGFRDKHWRRVKIQQTKTLCEFSSLYQSEPIYEGRFKVIMQGIPAFRDFTNREPHDFVILFWASYHDFEEK
jgi:hypothetical protein